MKITSIESMLLHVPAQPLVAKQYAEQAMVVAEIKTDEGLTGLGYTLCVGSWGGEAVKAYLDTRLCPLLTGRDPSGVNALWQEMYRQDTGIRKKGIPVYAISAVDIALWDLLGKATGQPVCRLLGGGTGRVPVYGSGGFVPYSTDDIVKEAGEFLAKGCLAYKFKIGFPEAKKNVERVRDVRKALGDEIKLMVDVNQRWDVATNIRMGRALEPFDLTWYEEPVLADNIGQCAEVARNIPIPVATGENEYTRYGFRDLIEARAATYLQPDIQRAGGIGETVRIAHLAAAHDLLIAPHLAPELAVHVLAAIPNAAWAEWVNFNSEDIFAEPPQIVDGHLTVPEKPGHGIALNPDAVKRYRVA
jgi:L-alanine-DL-glutamate epimerase-like enolase superfamily enzyme